MEAFYSFLVFACVLFFFTLISIVLLVVSTNETTDETINSRKEKKLINKLRKIEKADKAVLEYIILKEKKNRQKSIKIGKLPIAQKPDVKIVDLRETHRNKRQSTKMSI